jgi:V8-like Glu-specific endopeptidase
MKLKNFPFKGKNGLNKRKLLALPIAAGLLMSMFTLPASAAEVTIYPGDINGDGIRSNATDFLLIRRLLSNNITISNWSAADVNGDGTVSKSDVSLMQQQLTGATSLSSPRTEELTAWEGDEMYFDVYDYSANYNSAPVKRTGSNYPYSISTASPGGVVDFGTFTFYDYVQAVDERVPTENPAIVQLEVILDNGGVGLGTGVIVGENLVLTAGHCTSYLNALRINVNVFNWNTVNGEPVINQTPIKTCTVTEAHLPAEYSLYSDYDFALIKVNGDLLCKNDNVVINGNEMDINGDDVIPMELGITLNSLIGKPVSITGFPGVQPVGTNTTYPTLYSDTGMAIGFMSFVNGHVPGSSISNPLIVNLAYATSGQSGGAIHTEDNVLAGIYSYRLLYNNGIRSMGTRITPLIYKFVYNNPYID